jgi:phosphonate metabolism-associated iron-containing alcohol dehydrogenase
LKKTHSTDSWSYFNPVKVVSDSIEQLTKYISLSGNTLIISSRNFEMSPFLEDLLMKIGSENTFVYCQVKPNPDLDDIDKVVEKYKRKNIKNIIGLGGGSVMDFSKILSVTLNCPLSNPLNSIFRSGKDVNFVRDVFLVLVPSTCGTGSEVTPFATIWDGKNQKKRSLVTDSIFADLAYLDPKLTNSLNREQILYPALDLISHCLESLWNRNKNPITIAFSYQALSLVIEAFSTYQNEEKLNVDLVKLQAASTIAGFAISRTRTAIAHSISYPLTIQHRIPHGLAASFTLIPLLELNLNLIAVNSNQMNILLTVLKLLKQINIVTEIKKFVTNDELNLLIGEMINKERSDNYNGFMENNLPDLIKKIIHL